MQKFTKDIAIPALFILAALTSANTAHAESAGILPATDKPRIKEEKQKQVNELKVQKQELIDDRCNQITERVNQKIENYNKNHSNHKGIYSNIQVRLKNLIEKGEAAGYDVSKLKEDLETLNTKVENFQDAYTAFIAKLGETKEHQCGNSQGEFVRTMQQTRTELQRVRESISDIRSFYENTIRPHVLELKEQR
jgi:hypothetical protein